MGNYSICLKYYFSMGTLMWKGAQILFSKTFYRGPFKKYKTILYIFLFLFPTQTERKQLFCMWHPNIAKKACLQRSNHPKHEKMMFRVVHSNARQDPQKALFNLPFYGLYHLENKLFIRLWLRGNQFGSSRYKNNKRNWVNTWILRRPHKSCIGIGGRLGFALVQVILGQIPIWIPIPIQSQIR